MENLAKYQDIVIVLSVLSSPVLLSAVVWFIVKKFSEIDDLRVSLHQSSASVNREIKEMQRTVLEMNRISTEMRIFHSEAKRALDESQLDRGRIIHLDSTIQRHEKILITSSRIMQNYQDRLNHVEGKIIKMENKDEGA